jgi:hypothetical protein
MRVGRWIVAVTLALCFTSQGYAQWGREQEWYYGGSLPDRLEVDLDPIPRTTGAGPAGGWGVAAASANPAALLFGTEASASVSLPWSEEFGHMAFGYCWRGGIGAGFAIRSEKNSGYAAAWTLGFRSDSNRAVAVTVKRRAGGPSHRKWRMDFGLRWEGMGPGLTHVHRGDRLSPDLRARWRPGLAVGLAIVNVAASGLFPHEEDLMAIDVGLSYRAPVGHPVCLSLNARQRSYWDSESLTHADGLDAARRPGRSAVGVGVEAYEAVEFGLALHAGFPDDRVRLAWSAAVGPPLFRVIWCAGADLKNRHFRGSEFVDLVMLRMYLPIGGASSQDDARESIDPYAFWPCR